MRSMLCLITSSTECVGGRRGRDCRELGWLWCALSTSALKAAGMRPETRSFHSNGKPRVSAGVGDGGSSGGMTDVRSDYLPSATGFRQSTS